MASFHSLGFVPTMGYLHEGHLSLVRRARAENDAVVVSIFVNPTQFEEGADFDRYPRDEQRDLSLLENEGVDFVFIPSSQEIFPQNFSTYVMPPQQSQGWCGESRPGHFRGVCTILSILFTILKPDRVYLGRKDAQQVAVVQQMTRDLFFPLDIVLCPTIREPDGLAMSSRNVYLSAKNRQNALILYSTLCAGLEHYQHGARSARVVLEEGRKRIRSVNGIRLDYLGIVDPEPFQAAKTLQEGNIYIGAIFIGQTRLIDNLILTNA